MRESFLIYKSFYEPIKGLSNEQMGLLFKAIMEYQVNGIETEIPAEIKMAFEFFKNQFRLDNQKYEEKVEKNKKSIRMRWDKNHTNVYERIQPDTNHTEKEKEKEKEKENVNENENVNEKEKKRKKRKIRENKYPTIETISETEVNLIANQYRVSPYEVKKLRDGIPLHEASKGVKYRDYFATLQNWVRMNIENGKLKPNGQAPPGVMTLSERIKLAQRQGGIHANT